jgi:hypothetical protein
MATMDAEDTLYNCMDHPTYALRYKLTSYRSIQLIPSSDINWVREISNDRSKQPWPLYRSHHIYKNVRNLSKFICIYTFHFYSTSYYKFQVQYIKLIQWTSITAYFTFTCLNFRELTHTPLIPILTGHVKRPCYIADRSQNFRQKEPPIAVNCQK